MTRPRSARSLGVLGFSAAPSPADSAWPAERDGVETAALVAVGVGFAAVHELAAAMRLEVDALVDQDPKGPLGFAVPREEPDPKAASDRGRQENVDLILSGRVEPGPQPRLALTLVDCERRRAVDRTRIEDADPGRWGECVADWVFSVLELDVSREDPAPERPLEDALDTLDSRVSLHAFDLSARGSQLERARRVAAAVVRRNPADREAMNGLFWALMRGGRPDDDLLAELQALRPELVERSRMHLCSVLLRWTPADEVLAWTAEAHEDEVADELRCRLRLRVLIDAERNEEVETEARAALEAHPGSVELMKQVALFEESRSSEEYVPAAQELFEKILEQDPWDEVGLIGRISGLVDRDPDEALRLASRALEREEVHVRVLEAVARLLDPPREVPADLVELVSEIQLPEPADPVMLGLMGALLCRCGLEARGRMHLTVALDRGLAHPFAARAWALQRRPGDFDYAATVDRVAMRVLSGDPAAGDEKRQELEQALAEAFPEEGDPQAAFLRGVLASRSGRHEEARAAYDEARTVLPQHTEIRLHRALALMELEQDAEAEPELALCARRLPHDADVQHAYAVSLLAVGKGREAYQQLERTLKLAPDHPGARELMERLQQVAREVEEEKTGEVEGEAGAGR